MEGNYLVLYKASKNLDDIPYIERTSLERSKDGQYKKSKEGYYMVPFLGYQIEYCKAETQINEKTGAKTFKDTTVCQPHYANNKDAEYIKISKIGEGEKYEYKREKDLFPADYFKGEWFFSESAIETPKASVDTDPSSHIPAFSSYLVTLHETGNAYQMKDVSGKTTQEKDKPIKSELLVDWLEYEKDREGDIFNKFGERIIKQNDDKTKRFYVKN